jgi:hypothetical protein
MQEVKHTIFRADALRRYAQSRNQVVLPRSVCPRTLIGLWLLLAFLAASAGVVWFLSGITLALLLGLLFGA